MQKIQENILPQNTEHLPITTPYLIGHLAAEKEFLDCFKTGKFHHSWLICGEKGIGKATLAYRIIRYIFSLNNPELVSELNLDTSLDIDKIKEETENSSSQNYDDSDEDSDEYEYETSSISQPLSSSSQENHTVSLIKNLDTSPIKLSPTHPIFERLVAGGLSDLKIIEREYTDQSRTKLKSEISVEQIRDLKDFFSKTSAEGGYKIALIDSVDEMNANSANALLKILEEAPNKSLLFLICNNYEGLLDTIKSRCRVLKLHPLSNENMSLLLQEYIENISDSDISKLTTISKGSIGTALNFYNNNGLEIYNSFYNAIPNILAHKNKYILDIANLIGNSEIKLKIFEQLYISLLDNIIKLHSKLDIHFASKEEEKITQLCQKYFTNPENIFKIREATLSQFELASLLNLDYMSVIVSSFERLKNAY